MMTEVEWMSCNEPALMLDVLKGRASDRKLRLFNFACIRRFWNHLPNDRLRESIEVSERHADGLASDAELGVAVTNANRARPRGSLARAAYDAAHYRQGNVDTYSMTTNVARAAAKLQVPEVPPTSISFFEGDRLVSQKIPMSPARTVWNKTRDAEYAAQCELLREIFGNPFRRVAFDRTLLPESVISLARIVYDQQAFDRMPEIADPLEKANCADTDILNHCRNGGNHVRGCWAIDLLISKQ
jgi:hypothetical protein